MIAQETDNRANVTYMAGILPLLEAGFGDPFAAFDSVTMVIRNFHDAGNTIHDPNLAGRPGRACSTGSGATNPPPPSPGSAISPMTATLIPELSTAIAHLRDTLGDQLYESLARKGENMTTAAIVRHAYDQIDQARSSLKPTG